jgi:3-isopropylmalate/(R)-2-methylmalate dehydratase small subunit
VTLAGKAVVIEQDNVDTDVMYPGQFIGILDDDEMAKHLFEGLDPSLRDQLVGDTILVAGSNFGTGSSRENVPAAMRAAGIRCVVAKSFARIYQRNCINLGLPAIPCPEAVAAARPGSRIRIEVESGAVHVDDQVFHAAPLPPFMVELLNEGGLAPWIRKRFLRKEDDRSAPSRSTVY